MALRGAIGSLRADIQDVLSSGNFYVTEEIARELAAISNAADHLGLDSTFLATSQQWADKPGNFTAREATQQMGGALAAVNAAKGRLQDYKQLLGSRNVLGKQENELRELHQWAISSLKATQQDLEPFTLCAADRIKQFGDTMGVTDRYTGYRANLTRGDRDPFKLQAGWMEKSGEQGLMNNLTRGKTNASTAAPGGALKESAVMDEVRAVNAENAAAFFSQQQQSARPKSTAPYERMSVQEQAGINTVFPGTSESMQRFPPPPTHGPTQDFIINPAPNFAVYGRPMQAASYIPTATEYQTRYEWPQASKIVKTPWLRN